MEDGALRRWVSVDVGLRLLVGAVLVLAGLAKLADLDQTARVIEARGIADGTLLGAAAGLGEIAAGAALLWGRWARRVAFALAILYVPIAFVFHFPLARGQTIAEHALDVVFDVVVIGTLWVLATRSRRPEGGAP